MHRDMPATYHNASRCSCTHLGTVLTSLLLWIQGDIHGHTYVFRVHHGVRLHSPSSDDVVCGGCGGCGLSFSFWSKLHTAPNMLGKYTHTCDANFTAVLTRSSTSHSQAIITFCPNKPKSEPAACTLLPHRGREGVSQCNPEPVDSFPNKCRAFGQFVQHLLEQL